MTKKLIYYLFLFLNIQQLQAQSVDLLTPNGGENWAAGSIQAIQWSYSNINFVKLDYSIDGGLNYTSIVSSFNASANIYYWTVPSSQSTNCIVKISAYNNIVSDQSDNEFTISSTPYINLTSLNGGEILTPGIDTLITWLDFSTSANVKIEYSGNNGLSWILIVDNYPNTNSFVWTIPNTPSNECLIKVSDAIDNSINDSSNTVFYIVPLSSPIEVFSPNGGELWPVGYQQTIEWSASNITNIKIEISYDNGAIWTVIENSYPAADGFYIWTAVAPGATSTAKVKISDAQNASIFDESNFPFSFFLPAPTITIVYPNGGESIAEGIPIDIYWNSVSVNTLKIEYSINNGLNWQLISSNVNASLGQYTWNVPNTPSNFALIKLTDNANSSVSVQSLSTFSILSPQLLLQNFPVGLTFDVYSNLNINWTSLALNNQLLKLEYSVNNGLNWIVFANDVPNIGLYQWFISCPPTDSCRIKISLQSNPNIYSISTNTIKIIATSPTLVLLTPTSQEIIGAGSIYPIKWFSYAVNYVRIELSINGDTIYNLITPFAPAINGIYYWQVPANLNALNCRIKISNAANTNLSSINVGVFSVEPGNIHVTSGNTSSTYIAGSTEQITWTSFGISNYINIYYSIDSLNWIPIVNNYINSGLYNWSVPYISTDSVLIKVTDNSLNSIFDINDNFQKIIIPNPLIEIINPLTANTFVSNSEINIEWNSGGIDFINIDYSIDGGANWISITNNLSTSNSNFIWNIGNNVIASGLLRVSDSNNSQLYDQISFNVANPSLSISSPNGGESLISGTVNYISWQSLGVNYVNLYYSNDNGNNWNVIDTNILNIGYYNWMTNNLVGNNFILKISNADLLSMQDESDAVFSIIAAAQSISLLVPNGNETYIAGSGVYIDWQTNSISNIDISYSLNGGLTYLPIALNIPTLPSYYYWQVPDTASTTVKVKINKTGSTNISSNSASNFSIISNTPSIELITPNGGEQINANTYYAIQWNSNNCNFVKIYYSVNGGTTYVLLNSLIGANSYVWNIPNVSSTNCKIKIMNALDTNIYDISDLDFQINNVPSGNQIITIDSLTVSNFCSGSNFTVAYDVSNNFNASNNFRVHLSNSSGNFNTFTDIGGIASITDGNILCQIPHETSSSSNYTIRIVANNPPLVSNNYSFGNINITKANADFSTDKTLVLLPNEIATLTPVTSNSSIASSSWELSNGISFNTYAPQVNFYQPNKYNVIHEVTEVNGCSDTVTKSKLIAVERLFFTELIVTSNSDEIVDIAFENPRYGCAIFKNGNCIVTSDSGKTWNIAYTINNNIKLNKLHIFNQNWLIALEDGSYLKSNNKGNTWTNFTFSNNESINDMIYASPTTIIAVCNNGKIIKYNGTVWQNQTSSTFNNLNNIDIRNNTMIIVGDNGTILKNQNNIWSTVQSPVNTDLNDVTFKDSLNGFIAADFGYILKTSDGGLTWNISLSGADINFNKLFCSNDSLWAIGTNGGIYISIDNGQNWERFCIGTLDDLNGMVYFNEKGFIVGNNGLLRKFNNHQYTPLVDQLNEVNDNINIKCFPNPTSDYVIVDLNSSNNDIKYSISIKDFNGRLIYQNQINSSNQNLIDFKKFNAGIYFLNITSNTFTNTYKIIKTN